jgi:hypothetical protein
VTLNVSVDGAFVVMPQPPEKGQLVHLTFIIPTREEAAVLQGMVVRTVTGEAARQHTTPAGMGIQYYGLGEASRSAWEDFFHGALEQHIEQGGELHPPIPQVRREVSGEDPAPLDQAPAVEEEQAGASASGEPADEAADERPSVEAALVLAEKAELMVREPVASRVKPRSRAAWADQVDLLVEVPLTPISQAYRPDAAYEPVLYRICPPDILGLRRFRQDALERGGVAVAGIGRREPGSLAVVAIVHPITRAEFHVPGEVHRSTPHRNVVPIKFFGVTTRTKKEFEHFIETGGRPVVERASAPPPGSTEGEMVLFESADEAQRDIAQGTKGAVLLGVMLPLEAALDPFRGNR